MVGLDSHRIWDPDQDHDNSMNIIQIQRFNFQAWDSLPAPERVDINLNMYYDLSGFLCYIRNGKEYIWSRITKEWVRAG